MDLEGLHSREGGNGRRDSSEPEEGLLVVLWYCVHPEKPTFFLLFEDEASK